jgi:pyruvate-ferredoxin/flavodoxin oxidoreductase
VFFQSRETATPFYARMPDIVASAMAEFSRVTGRAYRLFDYFGDPDAERVLVLMGSGVETARETAEWMNACQLVGAAHISFRPLRWSKKAE